MGLCLIIIIIIMVYVYRHLAWDMGHGFKIPELYKTGWFVVGLSVLTALGLAAM